ncbi:DUF916 domain-containing protein [Paenibacillus pinisoli]|uniref:DUF916 domain-containing protein n=1 Tax=Paenibacillus pinisoli TaxID=1276110 RepID=A0A3A6PL81_9BACL|nr:DUF916 domain-containing protein [Paenibacillus pinisoli]RJX39109.1 DUF916 domain-containing protein [Paenibacillus pinisoli]
MNRTLILSIALFLVGCLGVSAQSVQGTAPSSSFSISALQSDSKSIFMANSKADASLVFKVQVSNIASQEAAFKIYATDVLSTLRGGWSYPSSSEENRLVGTWFEEPVKSGSLKAGESAEYSFTLKVPANIQDGQYIGAIVLEEFIPAQTVTNESGMSVLSDIYIRQPIQTVINLNEAKAARQILIDPIYHQIEENGLITIYIPHRNTGTILVKPSGLLTLRNSSGTIIKSEQYAMDSVYVGTTGLYDMRLPDLLSSGDYVLTYQTTFQGGDLEGEYSFSLSPREVVSTINKAEQINPTYKLSFIEFIYMYWIWFLIIMITFLLLMLFIIFLLWKRKKEKRKESETIQREAISNVEANDKNGIGI